MSRNDRKAYVLLYNNEVGTMTQIKNFLDSRAEIINWRRELPNCFFLVSEKTANELSNVFNEFASGRGMFLIAETGSNKQGMLMKKSWELLNHKPDPDEAPV